MEKLDILLSLSEMKKRIAVEVFIVLAIFIALVIGIGYEKYTKKNGRKQNVNTEMNDDIKKNEQSEVLEEEKQRIKVKEIIESMTLEEKVAQLFILTPEALTGKAVVTEAGRMTKKAVEKYPVCGMIYMSQNLESPDQVRRMINNTQEYSKERIGLPMFISVDEEGGTVSRFENKSAFACERIETMSVVGRTEDSHNAYEVGVTIGSFLSNLGFNMNNAPVADVLTNPTNTVIGSRSFGTDCILVSEMVLAEIKGLQEKKVIPVIKHYPGHGSTEADTHNGYAYTNKTLDEMMKNELVPFIAAIDAGVDVIMVSHISCPSIVGDGTPTSLSEKMIQEILREMLGYQGVVITDALNMGAIAEDYSSSQAAIEAIKAGVDILLMPEDFQSAYQGILNAVQSGEINETRIDESLRRIIELKLKNIF